MSSHSDLKATLLHVRAYLALQAQAEEVRNEAAWEAGSSREERAAIDALTRLDEALRELEPQDRQKARGEGRTSHHGPERARPQRAEMAA